jgi:hypothetical protein
MRSPARSRFRNRFASTNAGSPEVKWIQFRIGINVADIIVDGEEIYRDRRWRSPAASSSREPRSTKYATTIRIQNRGDHAVKNIVRPIEVFRVVVEEASGSRIGSSRGGHSHAAVGSRQNLHRRARVQQHER